MNGRSVVYTYDNNGNRTFERWLVGSNLNPVYESTFEYTALGELKTADSKEAARDPIDATKYVNEATTPSLVPSSTFAFDYDEQRNLDSATRTLPSLTGAQAYGFQYSYDLLGQLSARTFSIDSQTVYETTLQRDALGRVEELRELPNTTAGSSTINYGAEKKISQEYTKTAPSYTWRYENGWNIGSSLRSYVFEYSEAAHKTNQLVSIRHSADRLTGWNNSVLNGFENYEYAYDAQGRMAQQTSRINPDRTYSLDVESQLTDADVASEHLNFAYDKTGNQGASAPHNRLSEDGFAKYVYDEEGNVATRIAYDQIYRENFVESNDVLNGFISAIEFYVPGDASAFQNGDYRIVIPAIDLTTAEPIGSELNVSFTLIGSEISIPSTTLKVSPTGVTGEYKLEAKIIPFVVTNPFSGYLRVLVSVPSSGHVELKGTAAIGFKDKIYSYAWDHYNRLAAVTTRTHKTTALGGNYTIDNVFNFTYDAMGQLISRSVQEWETLAGGVNRQKVYEPGQSQETANKADEIYLMEAGVPLLQFDGNGRITKHTFAGNLAALDEVFAVEDFKPEGPTEVDKLVWLFADHQGTIHDLYVHTPFGATVAEGDYPTDGMAGIVKKKYEHLQYDPFGARTNYAGDLVEHYLHDIVSYGYQGYNYDNAAGGYLAGGNLYEPQSGRLMSPAGSGENPYVYGGNSPVDRSVGSGRQQKGDDFTSSRFDASYSHYLDPREGWNGNAEDRLFAIGKFAAWGVAIAFGSAASMAASMTATGVWTFYAGAAYLGTQAGWAVGETALEGAFAWGTGSQFDTTSSFGKNFATNSATGGLASAAKWGTRAGRYAVRMGAEVVAETTYDVAVNDADFGTSLAINVGASLGFDALGAGVGFGARKFANSAAGRATAAYGAGFTEVALGYGPRFQRAVYFGTGGATAAIKGIQAGHAAGMRAARTAYQTPIRIGLKNRPNPAMAIDTRIIGNPASHTAEGFPRDNIAFWQEWARRHPETLDDVNIKLINGINPRTGRPQRPTSPKINPTWIQYNPHHAEHMHDRLEPIPKLIFEGSAIMA